MNVEEYKKELIKSILSKDDKNINKLCNNMMKDGIELEDLELSQKDTDYTIKVCIETGFPNF